MTGKPANRFTAITLATWLSILPARGWALDEAAAGKIAETAAGCSTTRPCQTRARMIENGRWSVIVSFINGYRENGEPIFTPGGFVGFTISRDGKILDKMPGA